MDALARRVREAGLIVRGHGLSAIAALVIAEFFFKFHSFTLETLAFLATWYGVDIVLYEASRPLARGLRGRSDGLTLDERG